MQLPALFFLSADFLSGVVFTFVLRSKKEKIAFQGVDSLVDALGSEWPGYGTLFFHFEAKISPKINLSTFRTHFFLRF
jgi:hypothetical protein